MHDRHQETVEAPSGAEVVVVGGGVIGLTAAWRLSVDGHSVVLVDPAPGRGTSAVAAGMLAPVTELQLTEIGMLRLNLAGHARWAAHRARLQDATGSTLGWRGCGSVVVARDADDAAELRRLQEVMDAQGLPTSWLRSREVRAIEPALDPRVRGAIRVDGDEQVDPGELIAALRRALDGAGTRVVGDGVAAILRGDGAVAGVRLVSGAQITARHVVLAAGTSSGAIDGVPADVAAALRPVKGQILRLHAGDGPRLSRTIRGRDVYIVTRADGRVLVGATMEEKGEDVTVTAGGVHGLLRAAWELVPGSTEWRFDGAVAGVRPGTTDNLPLIGEHPALAGLILATGHFRHGVLLSPITAEAVACAVEGRPLPPEISTLAAPEPAGAETAWVAT